jgi:5-methylcytosine-specific restriction enzyme subunit McrC
MMLAIELQEWETRFLPNVVLSVGDRRLAHNLQGVVIRELRDGLFIKASSWIGVVRFDAFVLRIRPKLSNLDVLRMLLVAGGLERLRRLRMMREYDLITPELSLFDLVALMLADACMIIARDGLLRGYVVEEDDLPVMRGRLRVEAQIRRRYGQVNRLECRYDDHHADVMDNRILHTALALCHRYAQHQQVRNRVQRLVDVFAAACQPLAEDWRDVRAGMNYDRLNSRYEEAHRLAWIIMEGLNIQDLLAAGSFRGFAFLLDMNPLFEKFIEVLVRHTLRNEPISISAQRSSSGHIWDLNRGETYKRLRPDLLLTSRESRLAIDAKYKRYDVMKLHESDIYQTFLYAYAFRHSSAPALPSAMILYPADTLAHKAQHLQIRDSQGTVQARLHAYGVDIPDALDALSGRNDQAISPLRDAIGQLLDGQSER